MRPTTHAALSRSSCRCYDAASRLAWRPFGTAAPPSARCMLLHSHHAPHLAVEPLTSPQPVAGPLTASHTHADQPACNMSAGSNSGRMGLGMGRRQALLAAAVLAAAGLQSELSLSGGSTGRTGGVARAATAAPPASIRPSLAPDQSLYDASDPTLREAAQLLRQGLGAADVAQEEAIWSEIIAKYDGLDAPWVPDVVGRAWGNRGNARSRQGRLEEALQDYNRAISICPWSVDPVLNRGVVLEALGRWPEAIADYRAVLEVAPEDPAAWNNLGNATAGLGRWDEAAGYYGRAVQLAPEFSFASANFALAEYQLGKTNEAIKSFRSLLRRYPEFPDMRAALAAALWAEGLEGQAESSWARVEDPRYKDRQWLKTNRRWPPRLLAALEAFLDVKSVPSAKAG